MCEKLETLTSKKIKLAKKYNPYVDTIEMMMFLCGDLTIRSRVEAKEEGFAPESCVSEDGSDRKLAAIRFDRVFRILDSVIRDHARGDLVTPISGISSTLH